MSVGPHHLSKEIGGVGGALMWSLCPRRKGECFVLWNEEEEGSIETSVSSARELANLRLLSPGHNDAT